MSSITASQQKLLRELGQQVRDRRQDLGISAVATAEASGLSRVTLFRIERGEASVAIGSYLSVIAALGLTLKLVDRQTGKISRPTQNNQRGLPKKVIFAKFPQLKRLAWQIKDTKVITPEEALNLYERNWRHINFKKMSSGEKNFLRLLLASFGRERPLV